jgi:NAD(P)-dependent dehydrogenase (short-subunit alcohol dehydrogenase family)
MTVNGKVALVTGAGRGIGRATAELLAARGARVVVADLDAEAATEVVKSIAGSGGEAVSVGGDVTDESAVEAMVGTATERFGRLDCAVNNAGISAPPCPIHQLDLERWDHTLSTNLTSMFLCLKHEVGALLGTGGGSIVTMSSVAGAIGFPSVADYVASKHGVLGLTKTVAGDLAGSGIRVNAICPGSTDTPMMRGFIGDSDEVEQAMTQMVPMGRLGSPEEVAEAAVWLCSDLSSFVTGTTLFVDGGTVCR